MQTTETAEAVPAPVPAPHRARGVLVALIGFLVVVATLEGAVRLAAGRIDEPLEWYQWRAQRLVQAMEREHGAGRTSDIVFAGNSAVGHIFHMPTFERVLPQVDRAHNVALAAAQIDLTKRWVLEEVVPRLRPDRVVLGLTSQDVNANTAGPAIEAYDGARGGRPDLLGEIDRRLSRMFALARYRAELREAETWLKIVRGHRGRRPGPPVDQVLAPTPPDDAHKTKRELERIRTQVLRRFAVGREQLTALQELLDGLRDAGVEAAVVLLPMPPSYVAAHPDGARDFAEGLEAIRRVAMDAGVPVIDESRALPEEAFKDYTHVWLREAPAFSERLAAALQTNGW